MRGLLTNPYQFPARPPRLNLRHPAAAGHAMRMAPVANAWGGMTDLLTGALGTNTTVGSEINTLGPTVFCNTTNNGGSATTFIPINASGVPSEVLNNCTIAAIFQPRTFTIGQGIVNTSTAGTYKISTFNTPTIGFVSAGTNKWMFTCIAGHNYFVAVSLNHANGSQAQSVVLDMTTGQLTPIVSTSVVSPTAGTQYTSVTYNNPASKCDFGRVAATMISNGSLSMRQLIEWAADPWSLWYDESAPNLMFAAGKNTAIIPPPPTGGLLANPFSYVATATTNATSVASRPSALTGWDLINLSAATSYVRIYNKATAPVPASDAALIVARFAIPAGQRVSAQIGANSGWLSKGLAFDITTGIADTDATATAAGDVIVNLFFE